MTAATDRRVVVARRGGPGTLGVVEEPLPRPDAGQVRVSTLAEGVSGLDLMVRAHRFPGFPALPLTPGVDVVGAVEEVGEDVAFDSIDGARQLWRSYQALRRGGRLVWFGVAGTARHGMAVIPASLATRMALALIPDGRSAPMPPDSSRPSQWYRQTLALLLDHLAAGAIDPVIAGRFPLLDAATAHRFLEQQPHAGRAVLVRA